MKPPSSVQLLTACIAVALLASWGTLGFYASTEDAAGSNADVYKIGDQQARFQDLVSALPATGIIGYVSDVPDAQTLSAVLYSGLQYTLAPRLVTNQRLVPPAEWVIGDFSKPLDVIEFGKQHGLALVKDFGNGAVLYRNEAR
jgi:hypothetical protein